MVGTLYIDRQKVIDVIEATCLDLNTPEINDSWANKLIGVICEALVEAVKGEPAADVRENVSAKWIDMDSDSERYYDIRCSNCKHSYTVDAYRWCDIGFIAGDLKYCPNCGADMREKDNDEKK